MRGVYQVACLPCSSKSKLKLIDAGHKSKSLSNVKAHLNTPSHDKKVKSFLEEKNKAMVKSASTEQDQKALQKFQEVEKLHPGRFEMLTGKSSHRRIRCNKCNQVINLFPERGSLMFNIDEHVESCRKPQKRQSSFEGFVVPSKRAKLL